MLNASGHAATKQEHDQWGRLTDISYFDVDGSPVVDKSVGAHTVRYKYDDRGNELEEAYFDIQGNPMDKPASPHYQRIVMEYNDANQVVRETFFDHAGQPATGFSRAYGARFGYDSNGNTSELSFFDKNGKPANNDEGVHLERRTYDATGQETAESYFGIDLKPVEDKDGTYSLTGHYDEDGRLDKVGYIDAKGNPPKAWGLSQILLTYDQWGNTTEKKYITTSSSPLHFTDEHITYDEFSNRTKDCYFPPMAPQRPIPRAYRASSANMTIGVLKLDRLTWTRPASPWRAAAELREVNIPTTRSAK